MKLITREDLLTHTMSEIENIDIDEYTDEELALLIKNELSLSNELEQNNIVIEEDNMNIPLYKLLGKTCKLN